MKQKQRDDILRYREMCDLEGQQTLQRGMNFRLHEKYSVALMSLRKGAPYKDKVLENGTIIEYEGHDISSRFSDNPKDSNQPDLTPRGKLTQNGMFIKAVEEYKRGKTPELVKVYEKIMDGIWSFKGFFDLVDYRYVSDGKRMVYKFLLKLSERSELTKKINHYETGYTRIIPTKVKQEVWLRDGGKCVECGATENLHYDHDLPFSKGGTSITAKNIKILCMKHNLEKSNKIV